MISESERKTTWSPSQRNLQGDSSSEAQWGQYMKNNIELKRLQKSFQDYGADGLNLHFLLFFQYSKYTFLFYHLFFHFQSYLKQISFHKKKFPQK